MKKSFTIDHYNFDAELEQNLIDKHRDYLSWPLVYFVNDQKSKDAYVGETTDVVKRMQAHAKNLQKQKLSSVNIIISEFFNKSATLDVESNLIRYIAADGNYTLQNANLGIANHVYYQKKEVYWDLFKEIWDELRALGIARHSLEHIDNSDLFKYSPYKSLSREQLSSLKLILKCLLDENAKVTLIQGGAGTGKTILAIFLFKLLKTNLDDFNFADFEETDEEMFELLKSVKAHYGDLTMALVIPMSSFRKTISNVFKNIQGLSPKMVIGPAELATQKYDLVIVDEGHRLRRRVNLGPYFSKFSQICELFGLDDSTSSELDWMLIQSKKVMVFYDQFQSIKPSDVLRERFIKLEQSEFTRTETLKTQFRCKGGDQYVKLIHDLFDNKNTPQKKFQVVEYECYLYGNLQQMVDEIRKKELKEGLSRMVAGFAWKWISKKNKKVFDIVIGDTKLQWNGVTVDWVNSSNSINEVGCIHTIQGYDLNYTGVIIGPELDYDFEQQKFIVNKKEYQDKAGKNTISDENILKNYIINIYKTILLRGINGTFIYACNENLRRYLAHYLPIKDTVEKKVDLRILNEPNEFTVSLYDLDIAAGSFSEQQQMESIKYLELESVIPNMENYFACKVVGESMNKIIPNNTICLFEKYSGGSRNGLITLVEMTDYTDADFGSNYTVKEYSSRKTTSEDGWKHEEIILLPKSDKHYEPIILKDEETIHLKVIGLFIKTLSN